MGHIYGDSVGSGVPSGVRGDRKDVAQESDKSQPGSLQTPVAI